MKIGIIGGTFDPIHLGHLIMGEYAIWEFGLDQVIYIPTNISYHKTKTSDAETRYEMVKIAIKDNPNFYLSRIDIDRGKETYSYDTISDLKKEFKGDRLYFIIGADSLYSLESWYRFEDLIKMCSFIVLERGLEDKSKIQNTIKELKDKYQIDIEALNSPVIEISSTDIRARVKENKSIKYLLPKELEDFIKDRGLYNGDR